MLSIVMPLKDNLEFTKQAVDSVISCTSSPIELILIDDCSRDGTRDYINSITGNKKVYINNSPAGVTKNWNTGIRLAAGKYIAIVNNDIVFTKNWDVPLIKAIDEGAWISSPYHTRYSPLPKDFPEGSGRHSNGFPILGSCFMSLTGMYTSIGLFPEELVLWFNDTWLVDTVAKLGGKMVECRESYVHHYYSATISKVTDLSSIVTKDSEEYKRISK